MLHPKQKCDTNTLAASFLFYLEHQEPFLDTLGFPVIVLVAMFLAYSHDEYSFMINDLKDGQTFINKIQAVINQGLLYLNVS